MSRIFTNPNPTFYKQDGVTVNTNGKIYFYEPGSGSTTLKSVYSNKGLTTALTNPVILDSVGKLTTPIWLNGDYNIKITDSADVQIDRFDNYEPADLSAQFSDFDATITYAQNDFVRDTNGKYYQSLSAGNVGNDPSSSPAYWVEIYFLDVWNTNKTYALNDIVKYNDDFFVSLVGSNLGNTPSASSTFWRSFFLPSTAAGYAASSFEYRDDFGGALSTFDVYSNVTEAAFESIGPTGSGADHIWTALDGINPTSLILKYAGYAERSGGDANITTNVRARTSGSSVTTDAVIVDQQLRYGGAASAEQIAIHKEFTVPVDANGRFDVYWAFTGDTAGQYLDLYLMGYKV